MSEVTEPTLGWTLDDIESNITKTVCALKCDEDRIWFAQTLEKVAREARFKAEKDRRYTLVQLVELIVTKLFDNRVARRIIHNTATDQDDPIQKLVGMIIAVEGLIAAGKTEFVKKLATEVSSRLRVKVLEEKVVGKPLKNYYSDPARYAYSSQLMFTALRANANDVAMAAAGLLPTEYPLLADLIALVMADRTCAGDAMFAAVNYLKKGMLNNEIEAVIDAYPTNFVFSVIMFLDVSARRAEFVCKVLRKRPSEKNIELTYFEELRLAHYALMRALALRGAPVLYVYCDDDPMTEDTLAFLDPKEAVNAFLDCPSGDEVKTLWANLPEPEFGKTTEKDVSDALAIVRSRYLQHRSEHVRRVAHIRVA